MAVSVIKRTREWTELTGLQEGVNYSLPAQYSEIMVEGTFAKGQRILLNLLVPPTGQMVRQDSGFYYAETICGAGACLLSGVRVLFLYHPYYAGAETTYSSIRLFAR